eukprot:COSAG06_NODE_1148_length_10500_cov_47.939044_11_plen_226_part_00
MMLPLALLLLAASAEANILWEDVCTQSDVKSLKWCDATATVDERAASFVSSLQLEEKAGIMVNNGKGVERFHIPPYQWGSEGLHGPLQPCVPAADGTTKCPTSFPAPCAMASAFNDTMYHEVGAADGLEARAINNLRNHQTQNVYGDGIDYWSPTVNMQRDPRWGRNQEVSSCGRCGLVENQQPPERNTKHSPHSPYPFIFSSPRVWRTSLPALSHVPLVPLAST